MTILAIQGVPAIWDLRRLVLNLVRLIRGNFEGLNFDHIKGQETKTGYIRLAKGLNTQVIINIINKTKFKYAKKQFYFKASVSKIIPNIPLGGPQLVPKRAQRHFRIPLVKNIDQIVVDTLIELLIELQSKYTELYKLSDRTQHKLLNEISTVIFDRLKKLVIAAKPDVLSSGFIFSRAYRKAHPHFTDFPLILSSLHRLEDRERMPRTKLLEHELIVVRKTLCVAGNISIDTINETCQQYSEKIISKVKDYIEDLKSDVKIQPSNENELASKRVKEGIIKMTPYIETIIRQVVTENFINTIIQKTEHHKMRMYGEPFLPLKNVRGPMMKSHGTMRAERSDLCNLLLFSIPSHKYSSLMTFDGTIMDNAKLVIRSAEIKVFKPHISEINGMKIQIRKLAQSRK